MSRPATVMPVDDYETIGPEAIRDGDFIELPDEEPGVIWYVESRAGFMSTPKRERYIFTVRERGTGAEGELTIEGGRTVRRYPKAPNA